MGRAPRLVFSLLCIFGALWGGAYLVAGLPPHHWAQFPTCMTTFIVGITGFIMLFVWLGDI